MGQFKDDHTEMLVVLAAVWIWKIGELIDKESRSDPNTPAKFGYIVTFDVPIFVTLGPALPLLFRAIERHYH